MIRIDDVNIGDVLLYKETNVEFLVVDTSYCEDNYYTTLYLRRCDNVMDLLKSGNMISVHSYNDYTVSIDGCDYLYLDEFWEIIGHEDIETIKYFRLRGAHND